MSEIRRLDSCDIDHYVKFLETHGATPTDKRGKMLLPSAENNKSNVVGINISQIPTFSTPGINLSGMLRDAE